MNKDELIQLLYQVVDEINEDFDNESEMLLKAEDTVLYGEGGKLDSIGLIRLISTVEEFVEDKYDKEIVLVDEEALNMEESPFHTIATLATHLQKVIAASDE